MKEDALECRLFAFAHKVKKQSRITIGLLLAPFFFFIIFIPFLWATPKNLTFFYFRT